MIAFDFSHALQQLKLGKCVSRFVWPKDHFLYLVKGSKFQVNREPLLSILPEGTNIDYQGHIDLFYGNGQVCVFTPTSIDLLACDYYLVEQAA